MLGRTHLEGYKSFGCEPLKRSCLVLWVLGVNGEEVVGCWKGILGGKVNSHDAQL